MKLRQILIQYEIENNLTHDDMIQKIGIGRSTYFRWLSGESTKLKHGTLEKLSSVIGQDVESLLDNEENIKPINFRNQYQISLLINLTNPITFTGSSSTSCIVKNLDSYFGLAASNIIKSFL